MTNKLISYSKVKQCVFTFILLLGMQPSIAQVSVLTTKLDKEYAQIQKISSEIKSEIKEKTEKELQLYFDKIYAGDDSFKQLAVAIIYDAGYKNKNVDVPSSIYHSSLFLKKISDSDLVFAKVMLIDYLVKVQTKFDDAITLSDTLTSTESTIDDLILFHDYLDHISTYRLALYHLHKAGSNGNLDAQIKLGDIYFYGDTFHSTFFTLNSYPEIYYKGPAPDKAAYWYGKAASQKDEYSLKMKTLIDDYLLAERERNTINPDDAISKFKALLKRESKFASALRSLGSVYLLKHVYGNDELALAMEYFEKAAVLHDSAAMEALGTWYLKEPLSTPENTAKAFHYNWLIRAISVNGLSSMAYQLDNGIGVEQDKNKANNIYTELAYKNNDFAIRQLFQKALEGKGDKDYKNSKLEQWYSKLNKLGISIEDRKSVIDYYIRSYNHRFAIYHLTNPDELHWADAYYRVGVIFSTENNGESAAKYYEKGYRYGSKRATLEYAKEVINGDYFKKDFQLALNLLKSRDMDSFKSSRKHLMLAFIYEGNESVPPNYFLMAKHYQMAIDLGWDDKNGQYKQACIDLAVKNKKYGHSGVCANINDSSQRMATILAQYAPKPIPASKQEIDYKSIGTIIGLLIKASQNSKESPSTTSPANASCQKDAEAQIAVCDIVPIYYSCGINCSYKHNCYINGGLERICSRYLGETPFWNEDEYYCDTKNPENSSWDYSNVVDEICD